MKRRAFLAALPAALAAPLLPAAPAEAVPAIADQTFSSVEGGWDLYVHDHTDATWEFDCWESDVSDAPPAMELHGPLA